MKRNKPKIRNYYRIFSSFLMLISIISASANSLQQNNPFNEKGTIKLSDHDDIFGEIQIIRPSNSDILIIGQNFSIKWRYKGSIEYVTIALYKNYRFIDSIVITTTNDGEYLWEIDGYEESNDYIIGIWDYNDFNNIDFSDFFTINSQILTQVDCNLVGIIIGTSIGIISIIAITMILVIVIRIKLDSRNKKSEPTL
ncbi:MAG: hypothetical protein ACFFEY_01495 [Candidatus Thorarchaeota archaeon]